MSISKDTVVVARRDEIQVEILWDNILESLVNIIEMLAIRRSGAKWCQDKALGLGSCNYRQSYAQLR
jgi:hypothetical protein